MPAWRAWMHNFFTSEQLLNKQVTSAGTITDRGTPEENVAAAADLLGLKPHQILLDTRKDDDSVYHAIRRVAADFEIDHLADPCLRDDLDAPIDVINAQMFAGNGISMAGLLRLIRHGIMLEIHAEPQPGQLSGGAVAGFEIITHYDELQTISAWSPIGGGYGWGVSNLDPREQATLNTRGQAVVSLPHGIDLPETVVTAAVGRRLWDVVDHPVLNDHELIITGHHRSVGIILHVEGVEVTTIREVTRDQTT